MKFSYFFIIKIVRRQLRRHYFDFIDQRYENTETVHTIETYIMEITGKYNYIIYSLCCNDTELKRKHHLKTQLALRGISPPQLLK